MCSIAAASTRISATTSVCSLQALASQWIWAQAGDKRARLERARDAALVPLLCIGSMIAVAAASALTPVTYDRLLYAPRVRFTCSPRSFRFRFRA
jgi:hypothetical protein